MSKLKKILEFAKENPEEIVIFIMIAQGIAMMAAMLGLTFYGFANAFLFSVL